MHHVISRKNSVVSTTSSSSHSTELDKENNFNIPITSNKNIQTVVHCCDENFSYKMSIFTQHNNNNNKKTYSHYYPYPISFYEFQQQQQMMMKKNEQCCDESYRKRKISNNSIPYDNYYNNIELDNNNFSFNNNNNNDCDSDLEIPNRTLSSSSHSDHSDHSNHNQHFYPYNKKVSRLTTTTTTTFSSRRRWFPTVEASIASPSSSAASSAYSGFPLAQFPSPPPSSSASSNSSSTSQNAEFHYQIRTRRSNESDQTNVCRSTSHSVPTATPTFSDVHHSDASTATPTFSNVVHSDASNATPTFSDVDSATAASNSKNTGKGLFCFSSTSSTSSSPTTTSSSSSSSSSTTTTAAEAAVAAVTNSIASQIPFSATFANNSGASPSSSSSSAINANLLLSSTALQNSFALSRFNVTTNASSSSSSSSNSTSYANSLLKLINNNNNNNNNSSNNSSIQHQQQKTRQSFDPQIETTSTTSLSTSTGISTASNETIGKKSYLNSQPQHQRPGSYQQPHLQQPHQHQAAHQHSLFSFEDDPSFQSLTLEQKTRYERLFREIDVDGNGVIDFDDLLLALERKGIKATSDNVKHIIERSDRNSDGDIDFAEFVHYCLENEKQLRIIFKNIDLNDDGKIDSGELAFAFKQAGIEVDQAEALRLVKQMQQNNNNNNQHATDTGPAGGTGGGGTGATLKKVELNFDQFRDYLLLHPTDTMGNLFKSWRHGTFVDLGEDGVMPVDFNESEMRTGMWWRHLIAGGVAGAVSRTSTAPLDRLKVFLQVRGSEFNSLGTCLRHMIAEGGVISMWRGNGINVLKIAPETAMKFMAFDQLKRWIGSNKAGEITILERFVAGSFAGAVSQTVIYPMEVLKTRFCLRSTGQYSGLMDAARKIYSNGGVKNFYRGYIPNLIGIIPYAGIDLTIYETLKKTYLKHYSMEEAPIFVCLACGTLSSTFGQMASYPLALVRTRMQSESGTQRSSMVQMFSSILRNEGPRGLYRGITANIMKVAPAVSISYTVYEHCRRPLGAHMS